MIAGARVSLQVEGEDELLRCIPAQWLEDLHRPGAQIGVTVCLKKDAALSGQSYPAGWSAAAPGRAFRAVCAPEGKALFALAYDTHGGAVTVSVGKALDGYVRSGLLYGMLTALSPWFIGLHGVTLHCGGQALILSAPSGTGKTTLARLLEKHCGGQIINGDFALLYPGRDGVWFEPTPFCGTSGISLTERPRIDRIIFLSQAKGNEWQDLSVRQAMKSLMSNAFVPVFDSRLLQDVQLGVLQMIPGLRLSSYAFAPTAEAAAVLMRHLSDGPTHSSDE